MFIIKNFIDLAGYNSKILIFSRLTFPQDLILGGPTGNKYDGVYFPKYFIWSSNFEPSQQTILRMASLIDLNYIKDKCSRKFYDYFNRLLLYKRKLSRKQ